MTKIEWADKTINPIVGCSKVSRACDLCYAADVAFNIEHVLTKDGNAKPRANYDGVSRKDRDGRPNWTSRINYDPTVMAKLSPGQSPKRFFVNSMSDLFHVALSWCEIDQVFAVMAVCGQHTFQILTKRPDRMREYLNDPATRTRIEFAAASIKPAASSFRALAAPASSAASISPRDKAPTSRVTGRVPRSLSGCKSQAGRRMIAGCPGRSTALAMTVAAASASDAVRASTVTASAMPSEKLRP